MQRNASTEKRTRWSVPLAWTPDEMRQGTHAHPIDPPTSFHKLTDGVVSFWSPGSFAGGAGQGLSSHPQSQSQGFPQGS
jgi:hypothetical protein